MDSILTSIKKLLGIAEDYTAFDVDVTIFINTAIASLTQIGVGPEVGFSVVTKDDTWTDWLGVLPNLESVKNYVYLSTRLIFDPPSNSAVVKLYQESIRELEFRIMVTVAPPSVVEPVIEEEVW